MFDTMDISQWIMMGLAFLLVISVWMIGLLGWLIKHSTRSQRIQRRLEAADIGSTEPRVLSLWHEGQETQLTVSGNDRSMSLWAKLQRLPRDAGWAISMNTLMMSMGVAMVVCTIAAWLWTGRLMVAMVTPAGILLMFWIYTRRCIAKREALFDRQLMDGMQLIARSLRAGHPLTGAFQFVSDEMEPPISAIFSNICEQQAMGVNMETALRKVAVTSRSPDMKLFATSVATQMHSGGNLADMMDRLASVIRDRIRLSQRIRVLVAQTEFSKRCLIALPFFVFILINAINPEYMEPLYTTPTGHLLLGVTIVNLAVGTWVMNILSKLKY